MAGSISSGNPSIPFVEKCLFFLTVAKSVISELSKAGSDSVCCACLKEELLSVFRSIAVYSLV